MSVFKYLDLERHVHDFMKRGAMLFKPLSSFRALEDGEVRGDANDGMMTYAPARGLEMTIEDGTKLVLEGAAFVSTAKQDDIFVYCASNRLCPNIAARFETPFCVEITEPEELASRLRRRAHPTSQLDYNQLVSKAVEYRDPEKVPDADWALPEKLAFIKPESFGWQDESRIVIGRRGAMDVQNVSVKIELGARTLESTTSVGAILLKIGDLTNIARLHKF